MARSFWKTISCLNGIPARRQSRNPHAPVGDGASFSYDNLGRRTSVTHPNTTSTDYSYDGGSRLWVEQLNLPSGSEEITLQHNPADQITLRSSTNNTYQFANVWNPTRNYTSDGLNRLTSSAGAALSYDGRGNLSVDQ